MMRGFDFRVRRRRHGRASDHPAHLERFGSSAPPALTCGGRLSRKPHERVVPVPGLKWGGVVRVPSPPPDGRERYREQRSGRAWEPSPLGPRPRSPPTRQPRLDHRRPSRQACQAYGAVECRDPAAHSEQARAGCLVGAAVALVGDGYGQACCYAGELGRGPSRTAVFRGVRRGLGHGEVGGCLDARRSPVSRSLVSTVTLRLLLAARARTAPASPPSVRIGGWIPRTTWRSSVRASSAWSWARSRSLWAVAGSCSYVRFARARRMERETRRAWVPSCKSCSMRRSSASWAATTPALVAISSSPRSLRRALGEGFTRAVGHLASRSVRRVIKGGHVRRGSGVRSRRRPPAAPAATAATS